MVLGPPVIPTAFSRVKCNIRAIQQKNVSSAVAVVMWWAAELTVQHSNVLKTASSCMQLRYVSAMQADIPVNMPDPIRIGLKAWPEAGQMILAHGLLLGRIRLAQT